MAHFSSNLQLWSTCFGILQIISILYTVEWKQWTGGEFIFKQFYLRHRGQIKLFYLLKFCKWFFLLSGTGGNSDAIADYFSQLTQSEVNNLISWPWPWWWPWRWPRWCCLFQPAHTVLYPDCDHDGVKDTCGKLFIDDVDVCCIGGCLVPQVPVGLWTVWVRPRAVFWHCHSRVKHWSIRPVMTYL